MTELERAIAEVKRVSNGCDPWHADDLCAGRAAIDDDIATILNAVASGVLTLRADADLAVALMVEKAAEIIEAQGQWMKNHNLTGNGFDLIQQGKPIRALVPADALAELQALRDELAEAKKAHDVDQKACLSAWGRSEADLAVALMVEPLLKLREGIEADIRSAHHGRGNGSSSAMREDDRDFRAAVAAAFDALAPDAGTAALAELQALRDERDAAVANQFITRVERDGAEDHATETADELRQVRARAEAAEAELVTLRAQVERLTGALTIAANRLHRCSVDYDTGTREFIEVGEWADEARAALTEGAAP